MRQALLTLALLLCSGPAHALPASDFIAATCAGRPRLPHGPLRICPQFLCTVAQFRIKTSMVQRGRHANAACKRHSTGGRCKWDSSLLRFRMRHSLPFLMRGGAGHYPRIHSKHNIGRNRSVPGFCHLLSLSQSSKCTRCCLYKAIRCHAML